MSFSSSFLVYVNQNSELGGKKKSFQKILRIGRKCGVSKYMSREKLSGKYIMVETGIKT